MTEHPSPSTGQAAGVLIVIPCLNEEAHLERLVRGLAENCRALTARIVVADGGSTDGTPEIARRMAALYPNVVYLHNPKRLQSAAVNLAAATHGADAAFLIRLDAHADYPADYCRVLIAEAQSTGADSVVVSMNTTGQGRFQRAVAAAQNSKLGNGGSAHRTAGGGGAWVDHGHHALMRLAAFRAVGGYDESFSHNEDAELDIRLRRAGYKIWLTGKTELTYYPRSAPRPLFLQYFRFGQGRARTVLKHHIVPKLRQMAPAAVAPAAALALLSPLWPPAALPLLLWAAICLGYGAALALRTKNVPDALAGPAAMLMHAGWSLGFWTGVMKNLRGSRA